MCTIMRVVYVIITYMWLITQLNNYASAYYNLFEGIVVRGIHNIIWQGIPQLNS